MTTPITVQNSAQSPLTIAVFNNKGGVAKTTTAVNVSVCLCACGYRVMLVDLDSQGNATTGLGLSPLPPVGVFDVLTGRVSPAQACWQTPFPGLSLLPATLKLRTADLTLSDGTSHLRRVLELSGRDETPGPEVVIIDCPPVLGVTTVNALTSAHAVLVPSRSDPFSHDGLTNTHYEIKRLREIANTGLLLGGIILTMTGGEDGSKDVAAAIRAEFGPIVYDRTIPIDAKVSEAVQQSLPVTVLDPDGPAGSAYVEITRTLLDKLRALPHQKRPTLPAPATLTSMLNTLREWRADQLSLRRLPHHAHAWTTVPRANPEPETVYPAPPDTPWGSLRPEPSAPLPQTTNMPRPLIAAFLSGVILGVIMGGTAIFLWLRPLLNI